MTFKDCLITAVDQGAISREEAAEIGRTFDVLFAQSRLSLGDDAAAAHAKAELEKQLRFEAAERRRHLLLQDAAQDRIGGYLTGFRGTSGRPDVFGAVLNLFEHYGYAGTSSVAGRAKAIVSLAHGELADLLSTFRRGALTGRRFNKPLADDVVREALGEATNKPEAKAMADAVSGVFEMLRQRFNAAGGAIGKIEGGYMPQSHDPRALLEAGREEWKKFIRPRLDLERMRDPLTGGKLTPERLEQVLDASFDRVTTDGWSSRKPVARPHGRGAVSSQRAEHRFLHFKDADAWLQYNASFGRGDPLRTIFDHVNSMARDIAAMEVLGPNPGATVEWLKQIVQQEAGKAITGEPSLYDRGSTSAAQLADQINYLPWRIDAVYQYVRGRQVVSQGLATGFGTARNVITSAVLGSASILAAVTDPFLDMAARYLSGMPLAGALVPIVRTFSQGTRQEAVRSGLILDDFLNILGDEARYAGTLGGHEWSRWLADRTMALSALEPMTQARRHVFGLDFQAALADQAKTQWQDLPQYLRRTMEGYGLDRTAWDAMRAVDVFKPQADSAGFMRPIDIANAAGGPALPKVQKVLGIDATDEKVATDQARAGMRRIAEQYLEMILGQTERAVPSGTARARSFVTGAAPRGTFFGELLESGLQFKSFAISLTTLQLQAIQQELHQGFARGAGYAGALAIGLTVAGAVALQIKNVVNGKDPQPMDDARFWLQALQTGGGFGLLGDFLFADVNRFGHSLGEQLAGPTVGTMTDVLKLTAGNLQQALQGKPTHAGREAVNVTGRYTPVVGSLWYTRLAYRRVLLDQLQYLVDPEASKAWSQAESKLRRETRQEFWWRPGQPAPARPPRLALPQ